MNNQDQLQSITAGLECVHGGGKVKAVVDGAKAVYKAVRPVIKESGDLSTDLLKTGGLVVGANEAYKYATKPADAPTTPTTQPTQPATDTE